MPWWGWLLVCGGVAVVAIVATVLVMIGVFGRKIIEIVEKGFGGL